MVRRDAGGELRQDVALSALGDHHPGRTQLGEFTGDLQGADRTAGHENPFADKPRWLPVVVGGRHSRVAGECVEPGNGRNGRGVKPAARHHHSVEPLARTGVAHQPTAVTPGDELHPGAEPDARGHAECLGITLQVAQDRLARREDRVARVIEVAEGRHDATGVGVHRWPHPAAAKAPGPLATEHRALLEDRRLESLDEQPARGDQPAWSGADNGDASRHRGTLARLRSGCAPKGAIERERRAQVTLRA